MVVIIGVAVSISANTPIFASSETLPYSDWINEEGEFEFPVTQYDEAWYEFESVVDMRAATQLTEELLNDIPTLCSEMFQIKPYADKSSVFGLFVHSFVSDERIGKWDEDRYRKCGRKPDFIELCGTPRWINLYVVADADIYYNYKA